MKEKVKEYNQALSVIYEVIKFQLPKFFKKIKLDNGKEIGCLELSGIRSFFKDNMKKIDDIFIFLKDNKKELFEEKIFKKNKYDKADIEGNFGEFQQTWKNIKKVIAVLEKKRE